MPSKLPTGLIFVMLMIQCSLLVAKDSPKSFHLYTDHPTISKGGKFQQSIYYVSESSFKARVTLECYKYLSETDSILVLKKRDAKISFSNGNKKVDIKLAVDDTNVVYKGQYYEILKRTGNIAPGSYKTIITLSPDNGVSSNSFVFLQTIDSDLSASSPMRDDVNQCISPKKSSFLGVLLKKNADKVKSYESGNAIANAEKKIGKKAKERGLRHVQFKKNNISYIDFYYEDWFAGRYKVDDKKKLQGQLDQQEKMAGADNINQLTQNDLAPHPSLFSQFKTIKKQKDDNKDITGNIAISGNSANGQDPGSGVDNNYYEVRGMVEVPVMGLPVELEGLYTSQDLHRQVKTSYFRAHYDVSKVKDGLQQFIGSYNQKFSETKAKGAGMDQIYQKAIGSMESQKAALEKSVENDSKLQQPGNRFSGSKFSANTLADTTGLRSKVGKTADSNNTAGSAATDISETKGDVKKEEDDVEQKKKEIAELDKKIEKYKILLAQNRNNNYFDSSFGYSKLEHLSYKDEGSYKQLAKKSDNLLPDGQAKKFISGITSMDAGMFPKYASKYTMSGQMMKGLDFGYDLGGICETGITVGKTEYVGRDGSLDKYTCYSGRAAFRILPTQKISLVYYGYSPDRATYAGDGFFKNINIATPTFFHPVHVVSINYDAMVSKYVTIEAESAASFKKQTPTEGNPNPGQGDNTAWHVSSEGNIPNSSINLIGSYDKTGKQFENNTLPLSLSGTEQYKLSGKNDFFHSFLSVGLEYNYLVQNSFSSKGTSIKWGFDVKTHSKRYPTVALSYKPFTTFRSYTDTLNIPQRPLLGSVWTSRASYQFKRDGGVWRFSMLYNKCVTTSDSASYGNTLVQLSGMYSKKKISLSLMGGFIGQTGTNTSTIVTAPNDMSFANSTCNYTINKTYSVTGGLDIGHAVFGFCKYGFTTGLVCNAKKSPITTRLNFRFSTYQLGSGELWKELYSGNMEVAYKFKTKAMKKNNF